MPSVFLVPRIRSGAHGLVASTADKVPRIRVDRGHEKPHGYGP